VVPSLAWSVFPACQPYCQVVMEDVILGFRSWAQKGKLADQITHRVSPGYLGKSLQLITCTLNSPKESMHTSISIWAVLYLNCQTANYTGYKQANVTHRISSDKNNNNIRVVNPTPRMLTLPCYSISSPINFSFIITRHVSSASLHLFHSSDVHSCQPFLLLASDLRQLQLETA
jgi:hypothetical protein